MKTITVIKNIGTPRYHHKTPHYPYDEWDNNSRNRFNFVFKFPELPQIDTGTFFHKETPRKVIPTKQPTNRQTPIFETQFTTNGYDDQSNVNTNTEKTVPPSYDVSENDPVPDPMSFLKSGNGDGQIDNPVNKEASDEVEYIQTDGELSKMTITKTTDMLHNKKEQSNRGRTNGFRHSNVHKKINEHKQLQSHRQLTEFLEDFSDDSMHNVKHLVDPMKVKDSFMKYTLNQSDLDLKKLTNIDSTIKDQKYDSYGNVLEKSQSLMDASKSSSYNIKPQSKRPYVSPSLKKTYVNPSTTTPSKGLTFFSTTQKAYVAPSKLKSTKAPEQAIQQPMYSLLINNDGQHEQIEFQPQQAKYQQQENYNPPVKQEPDKKPEQQYQSFSIRNPLTTSIPVQHNFKIKNSQESLKLQPKLQSYVAVPLDASTHDGSKQHLNLPKRYVRHHIVFESKPPHPFMESPFQPA